MNNSTAYCRYTNETCCNKKRVKLRRFWVLRWVKEPRQSENVSPKKSAASIVACVQKNTTADAEWVT